MAGEWLVVRWAWVLPMLGFLMFPCTSVVTYAWSVANGHVSPAFAFISETGEFEPENFLFAISFNWAAALALLATIIRFDMVQRWNEKYPAKHPKIHRIINGLILFCGFVIAGSASMLANITARAHLMGHAVGMSGLAFGFIFAMAYICVQHCLQSRPWIPGWLQALRVVLAVLTGLFVVATYATLPKAYETIFDTYEGPGAFVERGMRLRDGSMRRIALDDPRLWWTRVCVVSEWGFAVGEAVFFLSLSYELRALLRGSRPGTKTHETLALNAPSFSGPHAV